MGLHSLGIRDDPLCRLADIVWTALASGEFEADQQDWCRFTGQSSEQIKGLGWLDAVHPDQRARVIDVWAGAVSRPKDVHQWECRVRRHDGVYRSMLMRAVPVLDEAGRLAEWVGTCTDIEDLRQGERADRPTAERPETDQRLRESRRLYRNRLAELQTIYASAPIGLCVVDRELRYVRINERLAQMNGPPSTEHIGRTLREVVPELAESQESICRRVLDTGQPVTDAEISGSTPALPGVTRYWMMSYFPLPNDAGEIIGVNITAQEITDLKRAEQQRQKLLEAEQAARTELERYNRLKDEFLATVSHELRSPLNAILGWTRLLAKGKAEPARALEIVERNASGLAQIVEDLLDMSRIISGKIHLQRSYADIGPLASNVLDCIQLSAQAKGITVNSWIDPGLRPIPCDPNRIRQIVWNLMTNAVKFTPSGGQVWLRVVQEESSIVISVKDTGQGIPSEHLSQIFGRFRQVDSSISRKHGGLGLGLAIVRQLVELHGGTVEVQSEGENKGATFTMRLPWLRPSSEQADGHGEQAPATPSENGGDDPLLSGLTVLVIDDDPDSCELASRVLREGGAEVYIAHSAERGFDLLMEVRPDVLISDLSMPQQDGYGFISKVRSCGGWCADLACIALTALARPEDRAAALRAGYDEYLTKPFDATALPLLLSTLGTRSGSIRFDGKPEPIFSRSKSGSEATRMPEAGARHILMAEDNQAICDMLRLFLEGSGYKVTAVPTVKQALAVLESNPVDVLLSDFRLQDGTAWELIDQAKRVRPVPAVMLSGYSDKFYIEKSKAVGFSEYLVKPVDEEDLLAAIRSALAGSR